jgi:hypothetical protein
MISTMTGSVNGGFSMKAPGFILKMEYTTFSGRCDAETLHRMVSAALRMKHVLKYAKTIFARGWRDS